MIKDRARGIPAVTHDEFALNTSPAPPEPQRPEPQRPEPQLPERQRPEPQRPEPQRAVRNRIFRQLAVGALIGAAFLMGAPALAQASPAPATMTISSDVFPTGADAAWRLVGHGSGHRRNVRRPIGASVRVPTVEPTGHAGHGLRVHVLGRELDADQHGHCLLCRPQEQHFVQRGGMVLACMRGVVLLLRQRALVGHDMGLFPHRRQSTAGHAYQLSEPVFGMDLAGHIGVNGYGSKNKCSAVPRCPRQVLRDGVQVVVRVRGRRLYE